MNSGALGRTSVIVLVLSICSNILARRQNLENNRRSANTAQSKRISSQCVGRGEAQGRPQATLRRQSEGPQTVSARPQEVWGREVSGVRRFWDSGPGTLGFGAPRSRILGWTLGPHLGTWSLGNRISGCPPNLETRMAQKSSASVSEFPGAPEKCECLRRNRLKNPRRAFLKFRVGVFEIPGPSPQKSSASVFELGRDQI